MSARSHRARWGAAVVLAVSLALTPIAVHAQSSELSIVQWFIRSPAPSFVERWQSDPSIGRLSIRNLGSTEARFRWSFELRQVIPSPRLLARATANAVPEQVLAAGQTLDLSTQDVFNLNAIEYDASLETIIATSGRIPEGRYQVTVTLNDAVTLQALPGQSRTAQFDIQYPPKPTLLLPVSGSSDPTVRPTFVWTPTTVTDEIGLRYRFQLVEILEGQLPATAMAANRPIHLDEFLTASTFSYPVSALPLVEGTRYAWQVTPLDAVGNLIATGDGKSAISTFTYRSVAPVVTPTVQAVFPPANATVPWGPPHLIGRITGYSSAIVGIDYALEVTYRVLGPAPMRSTGPPLYLRVPTGPPTVTTGTITYNERFTLPMSSGVGPVSRDSSLIVFSQRAGTTNSLLSTLSTDVNWGQPITWSVRGSLRLSDGRLIPFTIPRQTFTMGLSLTASPSDGRFDFIDDVRLTFDATPSPPNPLDVLGPGANTYSGDFNVGLTVEAGVASAMNRSAPARDSIAVVGTERVSARTERPLTLRGRVESDTALTRLLSRHAGPFAWRVTSSRGAAANSGYTAATGRFTVGLAGGAATVAAHVPANGSLWRVLDGRPIFTLRSTPALRQQALRGLRLRLWRRSAAQERPDATAARAPLFEFNSLPSDTGLFVVRPDPQTNEASLIEIRLPTRDGLADRFVPEDGASYLWSVDLRWDPATVLVRGAATSPGASSAYATFDCGSPVGPAACRADCSAPVVADRVATVRRFAAGDSVRVGHFTVVLTRAEGDGAGLTGAGEVEIPMLLSTVAVDFAGLKVNEAGEVFEGAVHGLISPDVALQRSEAESTTQPEPLPASRLRDLHAQAVSNPGDRDDGAAVTLPFGFGFGDAASIGVFGMVLSPEGGHLSLCALPRLPSLGAEAALPFTARNVCFTPGAFGGDGVVRLSMGSDQGVVSDPQLRMEFESGLAGEAGVSLLTADCKGFRELTLKGHIEFPRDWFTPYPSDDGVSPVRARFTTSLSRADTSNAVGALLEVTMERCRIVGAPGFVLEPQQVVLDRSVESNAPGMVFPSSYPGITDASWTGLYIPRANILLPSVLTPMGSTEAARVEVRNAIIGPGGFTADLRIAGLYPALVPMLGGWEAAVDTLVMSWVQGSLVENRIQGRVLLPLMDDAVTFAGMVRSFRDSPVDAMLDLLIEPDGRAHPMGGGGTLTLGIGSTVQVVPSQGANASRAEASLNGAMTLQPESGVELGSMRFEGWRFASEPVYTGGEYVEAPTLALGESQRSMSGFPITLQNHEWVRRRDANGLAIGHRFRFKVHLTAGQNGLSGDCALTTWFRVLMRNAVVPRGLRYERMDVDVAQVRADLGVVKLDGNLVRRLTVPSIHMPTLGGTSLSLPGWSGEISTKFVDLFTVQASVACFRSEGTRSLYVKGSYRSPTGVPIGTSGLGYYGFGAAFWDRCDADINGIRSVQPGAFGMAGIATIGTVPEPSVFNADVALGVTLARVGDDLTCSNLRMSGNGWMMAGLDSRGRAPITLRTDLTFDFANRIIHGVGAARMSAPGIEGSGTVVVHCEPYSSPGRYYVKFGEPQSPMSMTLAGFAQAEMYWMAGTDLPVSFELPPRVREFFGISSLPPRDPSVGAGRGVAQGIRLAFDTGTIRVGANLGIAEAYFYTRANGEAVTEQVLVRGGACPGLGGWYAVGRAYGYAQGVVGAYARVDGPPYPCGCRCKWYKCWKPSCISWCRLVLFEGRMEVGLGAGMLMELGGPNPTWANMQVRGNVSLPIVGNLGVTVPVSLGSRCTP